MVPERPRRGAVARLDAGGGGGLLGGLLRGGGGLRRGRCGGRCDDDRLRGAEQATHARAAPLEWGTGPPARPRKAAGPPFRGGRAGPRKSGRDREEGRRAQIARWPDGDSVRPLACGQDIFPIIVRILRKAPEQPEGRQREGRAGAQHRPAQRRRR